jgi:hypothetical protein
MEKIESHQRSQDEQPILLELPRRAESGVNSKTEEELQAPVRLRQPQRSQLAMVPQCIDDLVRTDHPVRMVMAVVEKETLKKSQPLRMTGINVFCFESIIFRDLSIRIARIEKKSFTRGFKTPKHYFLT